MATLVKSIPLTDKGEPELLGFRGRIVAIYAILIIANLATWIWSFIAFVHQPVPIGTAVLAYSLGLRHAIDADHIAAIDNVTRKLMQEGKRPVAVGFFFALGHSTVVVLASLAVALTANALSDELVSYREIGGIVGTSASALFLFVIAIANLIVLRGVYRAFRVAERGDNVTEEEIDALLHQRGWLARMFRPFFSGDGVEVERRGVDHPCFGRAERDDLARHQRSREQAHRTARHQILAAYGDQIRCAGAGADEVDGHGAMSSRKAAAAVA